uniref:chemotaxis protein n=1 Tax=Streptococcus canis TaxID=1329 RepID=UPI0024AD64E2|nr:chemotaxis protein [Streptococcus canis]
MTTKPLLTLGLLSFAAYKAYQKRTIIKEFWETSAEAKNAIQFDLDKIKGDLALIQDQSKVIQDISQDFTYKWRLFTHETQAHVTEIQNRMAKYQEKSASSTKTPS